MEELLKDPSKIMQMIFYALVGFVVIIGALTGKDLKKKGFPKIPVVLDLEDEVKEDLKAIRKSTEQAATNTGLLVKRFNGVGTDPDQPLEDIPLRSHKRDPPASP